ncbi:30S ribosomal protein S16, partial [bacterium]|nr:30S ribosomal protein S16 [bacterium]
MSTKIRLTRLGAMKRPFYRLVVVDSRKRRDGRYTENRGTYNPLPAVAEVTFKEDRILYWLGEGAELTPTAENLVRSAGIMEKHRLLATGVTAEQLEEKLAEWKAKQPKAKEERLGRAEKKAKKKTDAREADEAAAKAKKEAEAAEAKADAEAAEAKAKAEAEAAEAATAAEEAPAEEAPAEEAPAAEKT